jgi:hypothetical protein
MKAATGTVTTYLDFGMTQGGRRTSYDYREGQNAYDLFMGARYLNDLIAYRAGDVNGAFHPEDLRDNVRKHTALSICRRSTHPLTYYEIGSSVMGVIDAVECLDRKYAELDTRGIVWRGVDNSTFMNAMARYTHPDHDVRLATTARSIPCDVFFAKGVSLLYAVAEEELFCDVLANSRLAVFDYTFSLGERLHEVVGTGLPVTFLNLDECRRRLSAMPGKTFILEPYTIKTYHHGGVKATYDCVFGDHDAVHAYFEKMEARIRAFDADWNCPLMRPPHQASAASAIGP